MMKEAMILKGEANKMIKTGSYSEANQYYARALLIMNHKNGERSKYRKSDERNIIQILVLNMAFVELRRKHWDSVIKYASDALMLNNQCKKAYFRRGVAYARQGEVEMARKDLQAANEIGTPNKDVARELRKVQKR